MSPGYERLPRTAFQELLPDVMNAVVEQAVGVSCGSSTDMIWCGHQVAEDVLSCVAGAA
ncbi:MAG TPA: hypothetical protein VN317_05430 [Candidatus Methanoperedens sp.]|nr:hypothetical protein [Candidatus Methanoperedens sp.]